MQSVYFFRYFPQQANVNISIKQTKNKGDPNIVGISLALNENIFSRQCFSYNHAILVAARVLSQKMNATQQF